MPSFSEHVTKNWAFLMICLLILAAFLMGGSVRSDSQSLAFLRPLAIVILGFAILRVRADHLRDHKMLWLSGGIILAINVGFLIPIPAAMLQGVDTREIVAEIDALALGDWQTRPMALNRNAALNASFALFVPLAALILMLQLNRKQRFSLLPLCIALGFTSGVLGLLQSIGDPQGALYLYRITNNGDAVGIFANRSHQAIFLATLFPMLAAYYVTVDFNNPKQAKLRAWAAIAGVAFLIPLILVTGSRAGLIAGILGLLSAFWLYRKRAISASVRRPAGDFDWRIPAAMIGITALTVLTIAMARAQAISRLLIPPDSTDNRNEFWRPVFETAHSHLPWGAGPGGFPDAYRLTEKTTLLDSTFLNHAHNDFLELFNDYGALIIPVIFAATIVFAISFIRAGGQMKGRDAIFRFLGFSGIGILAFGSIADYPVRTPFLSVLVVIMLFWCFSDTDDKKRLNR